MYVLVFYAPSEHCEVVKKALFDAGAGKIGEYQECSWQVEGQGQFRPLEASHPFLGKAGQLEKVPEMRVEMVFEEDKAEQVIKALLEAHPYEEPAYHLLKAVTIERTTTTC
ncbi:MAG: NGG1p interacting factor NIF3 [Sphaerochaetaceae bacterium]